MDNINQTAPIQQDPNLDQSQQQTNSEFAEKGPLFTSKMKRNLLLGCGVLFTLLIVAIAGIAAYQQMNKPPELTQEPPEVEPISPEDPVTDTPKFAYIKNDKNVWISNIEGEEKTSVIELPITSESSIISLSWKNENNLGYSTCDSRTNVCDLSTYNFDTKSITPILTTNGTTLTKFAWSPDERYLAYMEETGSNTHLRLKVGTVDKILRTVGTESDPRLTKTRIFFSDDSQYIIYSTYIREVIENRRGNDTINIYPVVYVYQVNGAQIDEIREATYPFLLDSSTLAYKLGNELVYKTIGTTQEATITSFSGYNPAMSFDKDQIAYWADEVGFNNVVLGVYETDRGIHRNILRGVILPTWVSEDKIVGIRADSCLGERCLLYEFQTTSMVIVDVNNGEVISVDQGKTLSEAAFYAN